jgi:DNA-binding transcriptional MerR regulator
VPPEDDVLERTDAHGSDESQLEFRLGKTALPDKQFFKIGEAADIVGVKTHVLRYWESEFPGLRPMKTRGAHRMYRRTDVELACVIRRLLHQEGYTIPGAKKRVRELVAARAGAARSTPSTERAQGNPPVARPLDAQAARELGLRAELIQVRNELSALLATLDRRVATEDVATEQPTARATVTAVVAKTALINQRPR